MIKIFKQTDIIWHPDYYCSSEEEKKRMDLESLPVEVQANIFCEKEGIKPISITATTEIYGSNTPVKSRQILYILY